MTKDKIRILFKIESNKITVYEYKNNNFETIQDCGEDVIEYNDNFMNWFKSSIAYLKGKQELDYLIITDNSIELNFCDFDIVNQSFWNKERVRDFHNSKLKGQGLILKNVQNKEYYRANVKRHPLEYTVIFCDKNLKEMQAQTKVKRGIELPKKTNKEEISKSQNIEVKQNKDLKTLNSKKKEVSKTLKVEVKPSNKAETKKLNLEQKEKDSQIKIELQKKTLNKIKDDIKDNKKQKTEIQVQIVKECDLNKEVNIAEYYKKKNKQEEEERKNKRAKF